jgi:NADH dehydrogenase
VRASGLDWTIFRPSIIFGPRDDFVNKLAGFIRSYPAVPVIGDGRYRLQPIAADDVARCFAMALEMPETIGQTYEICGPDRLTYNELLDTIGRVLGMLVEENICDGSWQETFRFAPERFEAGIAKYLKP